MPYNIEVMSLGEDLYPLLQRAITGLNGVQQSFRFEVTPPRLRADGLAFRREDYLSTDIWDFLENQRSVGAPRHYIIAFVTRPLRSPRMANLFGSHSGERGLAAVTLAGASQYVKEEERYCRYYLVRYAHSFVNWLIKAHEDDVRKDCYFHLKRNKKEILLSINSAKLCDQCRNTLENPPGNSPARRLTADEKDALEKMRQFVSGDYPYSLVMKGGGVKGLTLAGALLELEKHFWFDRHVGTSAGAIAAVLLSANYKPAELTQLFMEKEFSDFLDAPIWMLPFNLFLKRGLYPGEQFRLWIAELLTKKLALLSEVRMKDLGRAVIYAARPGSGTLVYDSEGPRRDSVASFAVRCSMSIPILFAPTSVDGRRVFDGGLRNNFPLKRFLESYPDSPFIGLYIGKPNNKNSGWFGTDILDIVIDGEERELVDRLSTDVVVIDTSPIGTIDFRLSAKEKEFLVEIGRASALDFLNRRKVDNGPTAEEVEKVKQAAEKMRDDIVQHRTRRTRVRYLLVVTSLVVAYIGYLYGYELFVIGEALL